MTEAVSVIAVPDMHCSACAARIRSALAGQTGIRQLDINPTRRQAIVSHDLEQLPPAELLRVVQRNQPTARLADVATGNSNRSDRSALKRLGVAGVLAMQIMMLSLAGYLDVAPPGAGAMADAHVQLLRHASLLLALPLVGYCAWPFFVGAWRGLAGGLRGANMDVPVSLAIAIAFTSSAVTTLTGALGGEVYFDCVAMFVFLLLLARWLADRLRVRFGVDDEVADLLPARCLRVDDNGEHEVATAALNTGDRVRVLRGAALPADGVVVAGCARVDESLLTGESVAVRRNAGEPVFAATVNCGDPFELRTTGAPDEARFRRIARLAQTAAASATDAVVLADRLAAWFVAGVLLLATLTFLGWLSVDPARALGATLAVLVVACPCALSLATPAVITAALLRLRRAGVVVTRAGALAQLARLKQVYFDKTGTLTRGQPRLVSVTPALANNWSAERCLAVAAALQRHGSHPWARAFGNDSTLTASGVVETPGAGVAGTVDGHSCRIGSAAFCGVADNGPRGANVWLQVDGQVVCGFDVADVLRAGTFEALAALRARGLPVALLTGDTPARSALLASHMQVFAGLSPENKHAHLAAGARPVLMVGDGVNDLPVMAAADVSAAFVDARAIVRGHADVLLFGQRVDALVEVVDVARAARRITHQNLGWALAWNLLAIPAAAAGLVTPPLAALGMAASSLLVTGNASRLVLPARGGGPSGQTPVQLAGAR